MALDNQPFSMVEDDGFIDLMSHLQPQYLIPSRRYLADKMLPQVYEELRTIVQDELAEPDGDYIFFYFKYLDMLCFQGNFYFFVSTLGKERLHACQRSSLWISLSRIAYRDKHFRHAPKYVG